MRIFLDTKRGGGYRIGLNPEKEALEETDLMGSIKSTQFAIRDIELKGTTRKKTKNINPLIQQWGNGGRNANVNGWKLGRDR